MLHIHVIFITWCSAPSLFGCDLDYPIITASTVDRCSRSIRQHIERFNIGRLKTVQVSSGYTVNDTQSALVAMDGCHPPQLPRRTRIRVASSGSCNRQAGHPSLKQLQWRTCTALVKVFLCHP